MNKLSHLIFISVLISIISPQTCYPNAYYNATTSTCNHCSLALTQQDCTSITCLSFYWSDLLLICSQKLVCAPGSIFLISSSACLTCQSLQNQQDCNYCPGYMFNSVGTQTCDPPVPCLDLHFYDFQTGYCIICQNSTASVCGKAVDCQFFRWNQNQITTQIATYNQSTCYPCSSIDNTIQGGPKISNLQCPCNTGYFWNSQNLTCDDCFTASEVTCYRCEYFILVFNSQYQLKCTLCSAVNNSNGYYNSSLGICQCLLGYTWNAETKQCIACNQTTIQIQCLIQTCPGYYFINNKCGACADVVGINLTSSSNCVCSMGTLFFAGDDSTNPQCVSCNTSGMSNGGANCDVGNCLGFIYNSVDDICSNTCIDVLNSDTNFPAIISGGCKCLDNYYFDLANFICDDCDNAKNEQNCIVSSCSVYWWNSTRAICLTCSRVPGANASIPMINGLCVCLNQYFWDSSTYSCLSCTLANITQCGYLQCSNYFWRSSSKTCNICPINTFPKNQTIPNILCQCISTYIWYETTATCIICDITKGYALNNLTGLCFNCLNIQNSNKNINISLVSRIYYCVCASNYTYSNGLCICNISRYLFDIGNSVGCGNCSQIAGGLSYNSTVGGCNCVGMAKWNATTKKCGCTNLDYYLSGKICVNCSTLGTGLTIGGNLNDTYSCTCATNLTWNTTLKTCVCSITDTIWNNNTLICDSCTNFIYNSFGKASGPTSCSCSTNMIWNDTNKTCICNSFSILIGTNKSNCIICSSLYGSTSTKLSPTSCLCRPEWLWNSLLQKCVCKGSSSCVCPSNQILINNICTSCANVVGSTGKSTSNIVCVCQKSFVWMSRYRNCTCPKDRLSNVNNTICIFCNILINSYNSMDTNISCSCMANYKWNPFYFICQFSASNDSKIMLLNGIKISCIGLGGSLGIQLDNFNCKCPNGSIWNSNTNLCVACSSISNTRVNGTIKNNVYSCLCINGTSWDVLSFSCKNNTCKYPLTDSRCTYCLQKTGVVKLPQMVAVVSSVDKFYLSGDSEYSALLSAESQFYSLYAPIKCRCSIGYSWSVARRKCFISTINSTY